MELSEIINIVLGGSLLGAVVSIVTIRQTLRKARAEASQAQAESDRMKITNTDQATRILMKNIVEPLQEELHETRKEVSALRREVVRFRRAVDAANWCRHRGDCPVLERMRDGTKDRPVVGVVGVGLGTRDPPDGGGPDVDDGGADGGGEGSAVACDAADRGGQPAGAA